MDFTISLDAHQQIYRFKYLALYHAIRSAIHEGTLQEGTRLPSSRELAQQYSLSRGSVAQAYDMLQAEGYVYSLAGSGTYVADILSKSDISSGGQAASISLSSWGERVMELGAAHQHELPRGVDPQMNNRNMISFQDSGPLMSAFPYTEWKSALAWATRESSDSLSMPADPAGDIELRQAIAAHLRRSRGIAAEAEQICLFNGSMQAIMLLTQLLLGEGEPAVLENPCYHGISRAVHACGGVAVPAGVDAGGIIPRDWDARLLFVTPGRQFPTGAVLSPARRAEILAWAARVNAVIIEDDYDSEFRWRGRPPEPLKALDSEERVVYVGSFSKTMFASLRIGYAVIPYGLVAPLIRAKMLFEPVSSARIEQRALAKFMIRGEYDRHLRRMRRIYGAKHELFRSLMEQEGMTDLFDLKSADAGLLVYAPWRRSAEQYQDFLRAACNREVKFRDAAMYHLGTGAPAACFSMSHLEEAELKEGVFRLTMAWRDIQK